MFGNQNTLAALFSVLLVCGVALSQTNLQIPVNHAATGTAIGHNPGIENGFNVRLLNAKDQPGRLIVTDIQPAYWFAETTTGNMMETWMRLPDGTIWTLPIYPSHIARGGLYSQEPFAWTEAVTACFAPQRYTGEHFGTNWWWEERPAPTPHPITCLTTERWRSNELSRTVVAGLDRTSIEPAHTYFQRSRDGGVTWQSVSNDNAQNRIPNSLAITDVAVEDAAPNSVNKIVSVATEALDDGDIPLITGHVVTSGVYYTSEFNLDIPLQPVFQSIANFPGEVTWNLQISMKDGHVLGIAYLPMQARQAVYIGDFTSNTLVNWQEQAVNPLHPLPDAIPYDFDFGPIVNGEYTLLTTSSKGLYYSPNRGADWYPASNFARDKIRTPELRKMNLQEDNGVQRISIAGWYASYIGKYNPNTWEFDIQEISYDPTTIGLYQNYNQAWTGTVTEVNTANPANIALVDYGSDNEVFPDPEAVCVQVQNWISTSASTKTVFLGRQDVNATGPVIRPFLMTQKPSVVFNQAGTNGPVVMETNGPSYLDWVEHPLFADPTGGPAVVYDIAERTNGRFISFAPPVDAANRFWREIGSGWEVIPTDLNPGFTENLLAASDGGALYALYPLGGRHLNYSFDNGNHFTESTWPVNHPDVVTTISAGALQGMPVYIGGRTASGESGNLHRWNVPIDDLAHWRAADVPYGPIHKIVADPLVADIVWAHLDDRDSHRPTFQILTLAPNQPLGQAKLWSVGDEYDVKDIRVTAVSQNERIVDLTIKTPATNAQGTDHTIVKRWNINVAGLGNPLPAVVEGTWIIAGTVTIAANTSVTILPNTVMQFLPGASLSVQGTLSASDASFGMVDVGQSARWQEVFVGGNLSLTNCTIEGAITGIETSKASSIVLSGCTISNCGTGLVAYQPSGTGAPQFDDCHFVGNEHDGVSFLSVANAGIDHCEISNNGGDGLVMTNSYAKITSSEFVDNGDAEGGHGLVCFGSSPFMACNNFESSQKGEVALYNKSYPLMDKNAGAGENSFFNEDHNLIEMWDSYPLTTNGHNNFTVGSSGYFMADMSSSPKKRDISGNYWNPTLTLSALYPSSSNVYTWSSTDQTASSCGTTSGTSSNATQQMFASAIAEQSEGDYTASNSILNNVVEAYPDSEWSVAAVAMLFANQCLIGDGYSMLQADLDGVSEEYDSTDL